MFGYVGLPPLETTFTTSRKTAACNSSADVDSYWVFGETKECTYDAPGMCCCVAVDTVRLLVLRTIITDVWTVAIHITEYNCIGAMM